MKHNYSKIAQYHLPGLFEFYGLYKKFLPLYRNHPEYFYPWCNIASIYGAPVDCLWGGGRVGIEDADANSVLALMTEYKISPRLTFSNSLICKEHLENKKCNFLCKLFAESNLSVGIVIHSDLLLEYLKKTYPNFYFISSTTKVLTNFYDFKNELNRQDFSFVVPDFRLNKAFENLNELNQNQKEKVEFLCNECCNFYCKDRKICYENVSRKNLGQDVISHKCTAPDSEKGYRFSSAMKNPGFISIDDIQQKYLSAGFTNFKIEGRGLGSAMVLEFLLYYMTKPEFHITVREEVYLDSMLDLF